MKVEIGFDLAPNGVGDWFTLDDAVKGELNNTTYKLSGEVLVDVTDEVKQVTTRRGRSRTLEKFTAGVASVVLDNRSRLFDPLNAAGPYYGSIVPRKQVRISVSDEPLFTGNVEDYDFDYSPDGDSTATVRAVDGFALLADAVLTPGTQTAELTGARVDAVLDDLDWPATMRAVSAGGATLDADYVGDNINALTYLAKVELSEPGAFFMSKHGFATFRDRADLQDFAASSVEFGPNDIPFVDYRAASVTEEMKNQVSVTYYGGSAVAGTAVASDAASQLAYGIFDVTYDTLLGDATDAQDLADTIVAQYAEPLYRVDAITVVLEDLSAAQQASVLGLELGDVALVSWTPNNVGDPISQYVTIDQIEHNADPVRHTVTFTLSQTQAAFVLDDAVFGRLDYNTLGF